MRIVDLLRDSQPKERGIESNVEHDAPDSLLCLYGNAHVERFADSRVGRRLKSEM